MSSLLIAIGAGLAFIIAYHTYGKWLGARIFRLTADVVCPSHRLRDDKDYVPTSKLTLAPSSSVVCRRRARSSRNRSRIAS